MYPQNYYTLFPAFPRDNKVFVAMDFDERFNYRWNEVITPSVNEVGLKPYRVDTSMISDSIITEITSGIGNCSLFFADLTTIGRIKKKAIRNGNVMYEVGIAHAVRLPAEVILFRSDKDSLLFDVANIRVNFYDPDNKPKEARTKVKEALRSAMEEINHCKLLSIQLAANSLTDDSIVCLFESFIFTRGIVKHPLIRTVGNFFGKSERINSIRQLLEHGIIITQYRKYVFLQDGKLQDESLNEENLSYEITRFGEAVIKELFIRTGFEGAYDKFDQEQIQLKIQLKKDCDAYKNRFSKRTLITCFGEIYKNIPNLENSYIY